MKNEKFIFNKSDTATFFGVSVQAITGWVNRGCPNEGKKGRVLNFYLPDVVAWLDERNQPDEDEVFDGLILDEERARLASAQADGQELKNKVTRRELAPVQLLQFALDDVAGQINSTLESVPLKVKKLIPKLTSTELNLIKREIVRAQNAASKVQIDFSRIEENT